ncbi:MAG: hypothetical protein Q7S81_00160 [bacterium]|nr:hypothetical protein [bacterium]
MKQQIIGLKELRHNISKYSSAVEKGNSFIIARKSKPLFQIVPLDDEGVWETVADFTKFKKGGVTIDELLKVL